MLSAPNPDGTVPVRWPLIGLLDPLAADVAAQWKENEATAIATGMLAYRDILRHVLIEAREWTRLYAKPN